MVSANDRLKTQWEQTRTRAQEALPTLDGIRCKAKETLDDYPMAVVLATFGLGLGAGVAIGRILADSCMAPQQVTRDTVRQQVMDALARVLPESITRQFRA